MIDDERRNNQPPKGKTMGTVKIEKGIPIPNVNKNGRKKKYPWDTMEIGDSFVMPRPSGVGIKQADVRYGRKFTARKIDATSARVWRIA